MSKYKKVWKEKKGYSYKNKNGKKVNVDSHKQRYRIRQYRGISRREATEAFNNRTLRSRTMDRANRAKNTKSNPDEEWLEDMSRTDVEGIDTEPIKEDSRDPYDIDAVTAHLIGSPTEIKEDPSTNDEGEGATFDYAHELVKKDYKKEVSSYIKRMKKLPKEKQTIMETVLGMEYPPSKETLKKLDKLLQEDNYIYERKNEDDRFSDLLFTVRKWEDENGDIYIQDSIRNRFYRLRDGRVIGTLPQGHYGKVEGVWWHNYTIRDGAKRYDVDIVQSDFGKTKGKLNRYRMERRDKGRRFDGPKKETPFGVGYSSNDTISALVENKSFKDTAWYNHYQRKGKKLDIEDQSVSINQENPHESYLGVDDHYFKFKDIRDAMWVLESPDLVFSKTGPLMVKGRKYSLVIAPRVGDPDLKDYETISYKSLEKSKWNELI